MSRAGIAVIVAALLAAAVVGAQDTWYTVFGYNGAIPSVGVNDRSADLQLSVLPELYQQRSIRQDTRWLAEHDSAVVAFWGSMGDTVLHVLRELSGLEWQEREFDIYLVRHYPTLGSSDPLIIPLGGMGDGVVLEAAPHGNRLYLNLIFQLSRRMLAQAVQPERGVHLGIAHHPLMQPGPLRLDNLAWVLALQTGQQIIGIDSTYDAFSSAFWHQHTPGRQIFEKYLRYEWQLTPERPLADWIAAEPYSSELVRITRSPRRQPGTAARPRKSIEGLPLTGEFGFTVGIDESNRLVVKKIDVERLAFACGLRENDRIYRVDGRRPRSHKELIERLYLRINESGLANLEVVREGQTIALVIQPYLIDTDPGYYRTPDTAQPTYNFPLPQDQ